jgi:hypothetical protein
VKAGTQRRSILLVYTAILGALSIVLSTIRVSFPLGNPNLGSTPVSIASVTTPGVVAFAVGIIKGLGVSLWTGQALLEFPAGIGDGLMALFTLWLSKRINAVVAVVVGQISRYLFTSGMIALVLGTAVSVDLSLPGASLLFSKITSAAPWFSPAGLPPLLSNIATVWVAMIPAITASIVANAVLSGAVVAALKKFYPNILDSINSRRMPGV